VEENPGADARGGSSTDALSIARKALKEMDEIDRRFEYCVLTAHSLKRMLIPMMGLMREILDRLPPTENGEQRTESDTTPTKGSICVDEEKKVEWAKFCELAARNLEKQGGVDHWVDALRGAAEWLKS
jgi:hypothetical protein